MINLKSAIGLGIASLATAQLTAQNTSSFKPAAPNVPHKGISYVGVAPGKDGWPGNTVSVEIKKDELYDLRRDPGENYNVAEYYPEVVKELQIIAGNARKDLGDDFTKTPGENIRKARSVK